jgi:hypothetical protein
MIAPSMLGLPWTEWRYRILIAILGCLVSFPVLMTTLAPYDDEGYVMMTLRTFGQGERLYGATHTQYGPAYYFLSESLHSWLHVPLTQDGVRLKTLFFWTIATLFCYASLRRMSVVPSIALAASVLFHLHLDKLALEPGHPQEWILVLNMLTLWLVAGKSPGKWILAAVCVALVGMIKLNWGAVSGIGLLLQAIVAGMHDPRRWWPVVQVCFVGTITTVIILVLAWLAGSSTSELVWGLIGQHRRFTSEFYHPIAWYPSAGVFVAASMAALVLRKNSPQGHWGACLALLAMSVGALFLLIDFIGPLVHGLEPRGAAPWLVLAGPAMLPWLLLKDQRNSPVLASADGMRTHSAPIAITNLSSPMHLMAVWILLGIGTAYPTPGTQLSLATAPAWILLAMLLGSTNAMDGVAPKFAGFVPGYLGRHIGAPRTLDSVVCVGLLIFAVALSAPAWILWGTGTRIDVHGANLMRLEPRQAHREGAIVRAIQDTNCDYLVFDGHTHNRFYFWMNKEPLTAANPTFWPRMLTAKEQLAWRTKLRALDRLCLVRPPESEQLAGAFAVELRSELLVNWEQTGEVDGWRIGVVVPPRVWGANVGFRDDNPPQND